MPRRKFVVMIAMPYVQERIVEIRVPNDLDRDASRRTIQRRLKQAIDRGEEMAVDLPQPASGQSEKIVAFKILKEEVEESSDDNKWREGQKPEEGNVTDG